MILRVPDWYCPNCKQRARLPEPKPRQTHMHVCPKLRGLSTPLIREGIAAKVTAHEREDYINGDLVQTDAEGRPVMSVVTVRDNGQDTTVYAPTATGRGN